jgi:CRP/FNR family transcriptional regulator, cyclic AMP receptor protein
MEATGTRDDLRKVKVLADLPDADLEALLGAVKWRHVRAGEQVVSHLEESKDVFFAAKGAFRARLETTKGRPVAIRQLPEGSHFGEIAALMNTPRSLAIFADTDGLLAECPADAFLALMARNGSFATEIASYLGRTVVALTDRVFELAVLEVRFRIYTELLRLAAGCEHTKEGVLIRNAPTHEAIASAVGAQREAVTRELGMLANEGLVRQTGRELLILNIERLREIVLRRAGPMTSIAVDWNWDGPISNT